MLLSAIILVYQVVVGSFMPNGFKIPKRKNHRDYAPASASAGAPGSAPIHPANPEGNEFPTSTQVDHQSSKHHERQRDCEERICWRHRVERFWACTGPENTSSWDKWRVCASWSFSGLILGVCLSRLINCDHMSWMNLWLYRIDEM